MPNKTTYTATHITDIIAKEKEQLDDILQVIKTRETMAENVNDSYEDTLTFGQRVADKIASFG